MGALGMAILVRDYYIEHEHETVFRGLEVSDIEFTTSAFNCGDCPNNCEIVQVKMPEEGNKIAPPKQRIFPGYPPSTKEGGYTLETT